jgi:hypothetical protein
MLHEPHENEKWYTLYNTAMLELEAAAMAGRIGEARTEIAARLEKLKQHPGLYKHEYQALQDALIICASSSKRKNGLRPGRRSASC